MKKFVSIDAVLFFFGAVFLFWLEARFDFGWAWLFGSLAALLTAVLAAAPNHGENGEAPSAVWMRLKNDTSCESPFYAMPAAEPGTAFDGHSTFITQGAYDEMIARLEKQRVAGSGEGQ